MDVARHALTSGGIFQDLGFRYIGPVDGHDVSELEMTFRSARELSGPLLVHVHTQKGRGCDYAVEDPCRFHSPAAYSIEEGRAVFPPRTGRYEG